jgi:hypothetical protein
MLGDLVTVHLSAATLMRVEQLTVCPPEGRTRTRQAHELLAAFEQYSPTSICLTECHAFMSCTLTSQCALHHAVVLSLHNAGNAARSAVIQSGNSVKVCPIWHVLLMELHKTLCGVIHAVRSSSSTVQQVWQ